MQIKGRKPIKFCNAACRTGWWNNHPSAVHRKAYYNFICKCCGKEFRQHRTTIFVWCCLKKRRVAAYARVSTDHQEQQNSYQAQVDYYTKYIKEHDGWEFVAIYADEGITGCNTTKREGFKNMINDALAGKIDLIVTKSVSRFARNTVDSLTTIRKLKENNIECFFEKE